MVITNVKNYTSNTPVTSSQATIQNWLLKGGATDIGYSFDEKRNCTGVKFNIPVNGLPLLFQVDAKVQEVFKVLLSAYARPDRIDQERLMKQAERTAWKLLSDMIAIQMSNVVLERASMIEMFLSYATDPKTGKSFFKIIEEGKFKQLRSKNESD